MNKNYFLSLILIVSLLVFFSTAVTPVFSAEKSSSVLLEKVANDYTKKFCNGIGFGLSKESAMTFAMKENNLTFKNKKGIDLLSNELLSTKIANSVIDRCGFPIDLIGDVGIQEFKNDYISLKKSIID